MVARTGTPRLPNTSQNTTGFAANAGASSPVAFSRSASFGDIAPAAASAGQIAFHVGHEHRNANVREMLGQHLQASRSCLCRSRR